MLLTTAAGEPGIPTPWQLRLGVGLVYFVTALFLGDWALYTEIVYEAADRNIPIVLYPMVAAVLLLVVATLVAFLKPRLSAKIGIAGCAIALPVCLLAFLTTQWQFTVHNYSGQVSREASIIMVGVAGVVSAIRLRQPRRPVSGTQH